MEQPLDARTPVPTTDAEYDGSAIPNVVRLGPLLSEDRSTDDFEGNLEALLDRLEPALTQ